MTKKKYDPGELSPCKLRETHDHYLEDGGMNESVDCLFTGNECCERFQRIKCPLRCLIDLSE